MSESLLRSIYVMATMVEARDPYTGGHLWRVSQYSGLLAQALSLSDKDRGRIILGAFLHDIGKVGVPDAILNKPDRLTEDEFAIIRTHPRVGARILSGHPFEHLILPAVVSHHEMPSGKGYPDGLAGDQLSIDARIVGLCDAFDAMTSTRPYRRGMAIAKALEIVGENLGRQFDTDIGNEFIALGQSGALDHIAGHSDAGVPVQECQVCGPIIVVQRHHKTGDEVFCGHCTMGYSVQRDGLNLSLTPLSKSGSAAQLAPEVDLDLVAELVGSHAPLIAKAQAS